VLEPSKEVVGISARGTDTVALNSLLTVVVPSEISIVPTPEFVSAAEVVTTKEEPSTEKLELATLGARVSRIMSSE